MRVSQKTAPFAHLGLVGASVRNVFLHVHVGAVGVPRCETVEGLHVLFLGYLRIVLLHIRFQRRVPGDRDRGA